VEADFTDGGFQGRPRYVAALPACRRPENGSDIKACRTLSYSRPTGPYPLATPDTARATAKPPRQLASFTASRTVPYLTPSRQSQIRFIGITDPSASGGSGSPAVFGFPQEGVSLPLRAACARPLLTAC